jgi:chromosome segregation ATPase
MRNGGKEQTGADFTARCVQEWQKQEASIGKLESQQRRLKHQISLLGPKQQQQQEQLKRLQDRDKRAGAQQPSTGTHPKRAL